MDSELSRGVDGSMFVLSYTLVHPRILKGQVTDLKTGPIHLYPVLAVLKGKVKWKVGKVREKRTSAVVLLALSATVIIL